MLIQGLLLFILISIGFLFISFVNIISPEIPSSTTDTSIYTFATIQEVEDEAIIETWCLNLA